MSATTLAIRRAEAADPPAVTAIQAASPEAAQWEASQYLSYDLWVAVREGSIAGFLAVRTLVEGESEILNLAVAPYQRRQGVARALLEAVLRECRGDVFLEVRASNEGAQKSYKSVGFQEIAIRPQYYSAPLESAIVMKFHSC